MMPFTTSLRQKISYQRRFITPLAYATGGISGAFAAYVLGVGIYAPFVINNSRERWFSDEFVMTPESFSIPYKRVNFQSSDSVPLEGWFMEQTVLGHPSKNLVMCLNPYNNHKSILLGIARSIWQSGYSVLLFDYRSHTPRPNANDKSYPRSVGHLEARDAEAALSWLKENKPKNGRIALMGPSMGGALALTLASRPDNQDLVCCITDCAFSNLEDLVRFQVGKRVFLGELLGPVLIRLICVFNKLIFNYDLADVGPEDALEQCMIPTLVIHGEKDSIVPVECAYTIHDKLGTDSADKMLVIDPNTDHIGGYFLSEKNYMRRILSFMDAKFEKNLAETKLEEVDES